MTINLECILCLEKKNLFCHFKIQGLLRVHGLISVSTNRHQSENHIQPFWLHFVIKNVSVVRWILSMKSAVSISLHLGLSHHLAPLSQIGPLGPPYSVICYLAPVASLLLPIATPSHLFVALLAHPPIN
jgi:hypothetical protein